MFEIARVGLFKKALIAALACVGLVAVGCGSSGDSSTSTDADTTSASSGGSYKIALLLPQNKAERFEKFDRPYFEESLEKYCPDCELLYENAQDESAERQQQQAESVLAKGADVIVLTPAAGAGTAIAELAAAKGVPVVADTRPVEESDNVKAYVIADVPQMCKIQGESLVNRLAEIDKPEGPIFMLNGPANEPEAVLCKEEVRKIVDAAGVKVLESFDTPGWDATKDQTQMEQWMLKYGADDVAGIYCLWSECAGAVNAAMKTRGWDPTKYPITGLDTEPSLLQRMLVDEQYMTVLQPIDIVSDYSAKIAVDLAEGKPLDTSILTNKQDLGASEETPTAYAPGVEITKPDIKDYLIKNGWYTADEICVGEYKQACAEAGIE